MNREVDKYMQTLPPIPTRDQEIRRAQRLDNLRIAAFNQMYSGDPTFVRDFLVSNGIDQDELKSQKTKENGSPTRLGEYLFNESSFKIRDKFSELLNKYEASNEPIPLRGRIEQARNQLVSGAYRFVVGVAYQYSRFEVPVIDLVQEGNIGLILGAECFDIRRGYRFLSYAVWKIRAAIQMGIGKNYPNRSTSYHQITSGKVSHHQHISASNRIGDGTTTILDSLVGGDLLDEVGNIDDIDAFTNKLIKSCKFNGNKAIILKRRMLKNGDDKATLQQVGDSLSLSRERVRQIEVDIKKNIKIAAMRQGLEGVIHDLITT